MYIFEKVMLIFNVLMNIQISIHLIKKYLLYFNYCWIIKRKPFQNINIFLNIFLDVKISLFHHKYSGKYSYEYL